MNTGTQGLRYTVAVDKRFRSPGPQPNGIQASHDGIWCIDQVDSKVYLLDWADGAVLQEFQTATEHSSGITLDGDGNLWITSTWQLEVAKVDPPGAGLTAQAERAGGNGKPSGSHGIEWRAGRIYLAAPPTQRLHVMDAATWEQLRALPVPPAAAPEGSWRAIPILVPASPRRPSRPAATASRRGRTASSGAPAGSTWGRPRRSACT